MRALEICCVVIVLLYVTLRLRGAHTRRRVAMRLALLALAGFVGEDSVIRAYGFYAYDGAWSVFLDRVPLLIVVIWPIVIDSATELARGLGARRLALAAGAIILADAALIEPIAVQAGLWRWSEPGLFAVPPIGILGWAFFGAAATGWFERNDRQRRPPLADVAVIAVAPLAAHALLVATWWALLRWVNGPILSWGAAIAAWMMMVPLATLAWRRGLGRTLAPKDLVRRAPGAAFFFVLLIVWGRDVAPLVAYAIAFALPYVALLPWPTRVPARSH